MVTINGDTGIDAVQSGAVTFEDMPAGSVIQVANYTTGAMATGTTLIPYDNTIPQITEGTQFMSLAFAPKKANSLLKITSTAFMSSQYVSALALALFKDSTTNAISTAFVSGSADREHQLVTITYLTVSSINTLTITARGGSNVAGTLTFNGIGGVAYYGGSLASSITIEEIAQ